MHYKIQWVLFSMSFNVPVHAKQHGFVIKFGEDIRKKEKREEKKKKKSEPELAIQESLVSEIRVAILLVENTKRSQKST